MTLRGGSLIVAKTAVDHRRQCENRPSRAKLNVNSSQTFTTHTFNIPVPVAGCGTLVVMVLALVHLEHHVLRLGLAGPEHPSLCASCGKSIESGLKATAPTPV